uniref:cuticle collagen 1-like isoform X4 n=1 Tax=Halichoerus grypus TaxID=9711 RepID=UPI001659670B|nr:cuticle collagen 1-like isoform X4 [Halichoerus grypus]
MARYLGSGDGEECPLSRRVSSAGAPGPSLPRRPEALLGPRPAVSGPGRPSSAPRHCPRGPPRAPGPPRGGVPLSLGARLPSPAPAALGGRGVKGRAGRASRGERAGANAGSATRAAPLPQRRRRPGPCCCCQLVERTLSMRERRPHPESLHKCHLHW